MFLSISGNLPIGGFLKSHCRLVCILIEFSKRFSTCLLAKTGLFKDHGENLTWKESSVKIDFDFYTTHFELNLKSLNSTSAEVVLTDFVCLHFAKSSNSLEICKFVDKHE